MDTSLISDESHVGEQTSVGHYSVIEPGVTIGSGCIIGHHVVIREGTTIGNDVRIDDHASIGKQPMKAANSAITSGQKVGPAQIGSGSIIGTGAIVYAGTQVGDGVLIADLATVREDVSIGEKTIVGRGVSIENKCVIGCSCKLETNAYITAYSTIEDFVFVAPGVLTSNDNYVGRTKERFDHFGGVTVRQGGRLGVGSVILPGIEIKSDALVGAGAVVTRDAPSQMIVTGVPGRPAREVPPEQLLENQTT